MELDTAMSPKPFLATKTLVIRSGMLVPAARNVSPITCETKDTRDFSFAGYGTGDRFLINNFQSVKLDLFKIPKHKNAFYKARVKFSEGHSGYFWQSSLLYFAFIELELSLIEYPLNTYLCWYLQGFPNFLCPPDH